MAINVGSPDDDDDALNATINTTPLVDVMLVLLIIFLITIPVVSHTIPVRLPREVNHPSIVKPQTITVAITRDGDVYWNEQPVPDQAALLVLLKGAAAQVPQPEINVRGDQDVRYEPIGRVVVALQRAGIAKVAFITEPPPNGG